MNADELTRKLAEAAAGGERALRASDERLLERCAALISLLWRRAEPARAAAR